MTRSGIFVALIGISFGLVALGCGAAKETTSGNTAAPTTGTPPGGPQVANPEEVLAKLPGGAEFAVGKKAYANNGCVRCHKLGETGGMAMGGPGGPPGGGAGGPGMGKGGGRGGPDLTKAGSHAEHTNQWLADHIRDPKKHNQRSSMPSYSVDKISDTDLDKLAEFLASLK